MQTTGELWIEPQDRDLCSGWNHLPAQADLLKSPGLKSQFDWELNAKRAKFRTLKNLALKDGEKDRECQGFAGYHACVSCCP